MKPVSSCSIVFDRRQRADATHRGSVELFLTVNRRHKYISTGVRVCSTEWQNGRVVNRPDAVSLNEHIEKMYNFVISIMHTPGASVESVITAARRGSGDLLSWIKAEREQRTDLAPHTLRHQKTTLNDLEAWGQLGTFETISPATLHLWDAHLRKRKLLPSTLLRYHKDLSSYLERAYKQGLLSENPYRRFTLPAVDNTTAIKYLTPEERDRIHALDFSGTAAQVRDMFIFCCYTGLSYADMQNMSPEDIEGQPGNYLLIARRQKTGSPYRLTLLPQAEAIAARYAFRFPRLSNAKCNVYLKGIQAAASIKTKLTMHVARHTFATWALNNGIKIEIVSKMLAHADIHTTQVYARVLQQSVSKGFETLRNLDSAPGSTPDSTPE